METDTHKWLKKIALQFLREKGMQAVCKEVQFKVGIADCCGINFKREEVRIVECKATKQDYLRDKKLLNLYSSYFPECHYFYIICPENVIPTELIAPGIGLIYVNDKDEYKIIKKPFKNTKRLKTMFKTTMKHLIHRLSNELYFKDEKQYIDETKEKYKRSANIYLAAIRCPKCKHVTKELIASKTETVKCSHCKQFIDIKNTKVRLITGYNNKFLERIDELRKL